MKSVIRKLAVALAAAAGLSSAQAGVLTYQDVVFTTTWADNVLRLEIDAARHSGDWSRAASIGALSIKDIGSFQSVNVASAPKGVERWRMSARELTANGCSGGSGRSDRNREKTSLCLTGTPIALTDNMVFTFAFTGAPDPDQLHLKVNFLDASNNRIGDLLSKTIASAPIAAAQPAPQPAPEPVTTTPLMTTPVTTTPVTTTPVTTTSAADPAATTAPSTAPASATTSGKETFPVENSVVDSPAPPPSLGTQPVLVLEQVAQVDKASEVPEPHAIALLLGGLTLMGLGLRKRSR